MDIAWPQRAVQAVTDLNNKIPQEWLVAPSVLEQYPTGSDIRPLARTSGILTDHELEITDPLKDATHLLACLAKRAYSAEEVITAFAKRAAIAQQAVSCLADFFPEEGLQRAKELDKHLRETGKTVGPLHGLPISLKSHYHLKGTIASAGFSNYVISQETAHVVRILYDAGAVFYCKTNLPQAIMHLETHSFWGLARNPLNTALSPGGSSGGCSALMAFGGSPMSMGSDIGGSLRQPAASTGFWTLKASSNRVPRGNMFAINPGFDSILGVLGPIGRSLQDIDLFFKVVLGSEPWRQDHSLHHLPWREGREKNPEKLRIAFMEHDGVVRPHPPILRGIRELRKKLAATERFEIVDYDTSLYASAHDLAFELYFPDGGARVRDTAASAGDPLLPLTEWVTMRPDVKDHTIHELWKLNAKREKFRAEFLKHWNHHNIDVLICPAAPQAASQIGTSKYWNFTSIFNVVDYPAIVFPTGLIVDTNLDQAAQLEILSQADAEVQALYDPQIYKEMPICLQAVGRRCEDEHLMEAVRSIKEYLPL